MLFSLAGASVLSIKPLPRASAPAVMCSPWTAADAAAAASLGISPLDGANRELLDNVYPKDWQDPEPPEVYDLVAIGAGAGGLVSSKQSARRGARSALVSEHLAGGDCLNVGCVPSKALLRCAKAAREARRAHEFGVVFGTRDGGHVQVDFPKVMARMRALRAKIAPADAHTATVAAGADVYQGRARFVGAHEIEVNGRRLRFKKAVIATGGRASIPSHIKGLDSVPYLTNNNLFNLEALPERLTVLGAGAVGLEMAQAFATFGSKVTVVCRSNRVCGRNDPDAAAAIKAALERDGVTFRMGWSTREVAKRDDGTIVLRGDPGGEGGTATELDELECDALLVATGRVPNVGDLGLEAAGVEYDTAAGVKIDELLRTTNPDVFAVGDCAAGVPRFTHVAGEMAKMAVENAVFGGEWSLKSLVVPSSVYTEPELASVGVTEPDAAEVDTYGCDLSGMDRPILDGDDDDGGFVRVHCAKGSDTIVGATIVAPRACEMINEITLAMHAGVGLGVVARVVHPYPTAGEGVMQAGLGYIRANWKRL